MAITPPNESTSARHNVGHSSAPVHMDEGPVLPMGPVNEHQRFSTSNAKMSQPESAKTPGRGGCQGEVPVIPGDCGMPAADLSSKRAK